MLPSFGCHEVSSAKLKAVSVDMIAAMSSEITRAEPAKPAAMPMATNMPAPIIAPTLMAVASNNPKVCLNLDWELLFPLIDDTLKDLSESPIINRN